MRYYIADLHFFHAAQNQQMDCRGFANLEQMHEYMIMKWNRKVQKNDEVVIIGDFSFGKSEETISLLHRLNGKLFLIQGNHDKFLNTQSTHCFQWLNHTPNCRTIKEESFFAIIRLFVIINNTELMKMAIPKRICSMGMSITLWISA